ncbi:SufE family protein [Ahrensia marina]|uniref:Cysteine desufuration protein SufE n=1 Tax=Ahrensia marina TaxID=1514904 RepID=A0A0N0VLY7_9HYPH|nr:SufE family protein [Ahrensia marina]KPB02261.1 cysteine desufuration protein SufE [Ahrensia marina]
MANDIKTILDDFEFLDDWEDKYRYVIELGKALPELDEAKCTPENKVNGCVSQVWLATSVSDADPKILHFEGTSDAHIVRGLVAIMIAALSGRKADEIIAFDAENLLQNLGLDSHLSPQRSNGLRAMIERMKLDAKTATVN